MYHAEKANKQRSGNYSLRDWARFIGQSTMLLEMHSMCLPAMPQEFLLFSSFPLLSLLLCSVPVIPDCLIRLIDL